MAKDNSSPVEILKIFAALRNRKALEKTLNKARTQFNDARVEYESTNEQLQVLQTQVSDAQQRMVEARNIITTIGNQLQIMDLSGAGAISETKGDVSYVIDGKKYHADKNDKNEVSVIQLKEWKKQKQTDEDSDDSDTDENLVQAYHELIKIKK